MRKTITVKLPQIVVDLPSFQFFERVVANDPKDITMSTAIRRALVAYSQRHLDSKLCNPDGLQLRDLFQTPRMGRPSFRRDDETPEEYKLRRQEARQAKVPVVPDVVVQINPAVESAWEIRRKIQAEELAARQRDGVSPATSSSILE